MSALLAGWLPVYAAPIEGDALVSLGARPLGVGKVAAAITLLSLLSHERPRGVLLFGVAGAYPVRHRDGAVLAVGDLCVVCEEMLADEGVALPEGFRDLHAMGLGECGPFAADGIVTAAIAQQLVLRSVRGATVSTCSGNDELSLLLARRTNAEVETMEGAALAMVCARAFVPFVQVRAISNWTGDRGRGGFDLLRAAAVVQAAVRRLLA
ncbi:hypothetical protein LBMAG49_20920 [Planctomycetota bacterium]|nr:futalosine hydrolase [Planctomycetota bacterium]GDY02763.1 hypothetical protein LBMAG49_20920 [Planctomycetota bacterium]